MTDPLSHLEAEQLLPAAALDILEGEELVRLQAHLQGCSECPGLLESYREVVAGLAATVPEQPFHPARSERLRARLLARTGRIPPPPPQALPSGGSRVSRWAGWAVAAGLVGVLLVHHSIHRPVAYGWLAAGILILVLLAMGAYVRIQQDRVAALEERLASLRRQSTSE